MTANQPNPQPNKLTLDEIRHKITIQIVKARVPGYKQTKVELNDEVSIVPDVYIDNIVSLINQAIAEAIEYIIGADETDDLTDENIEPIHDEWAFRNPLRAEQRQRLTAYLNPKTRR